MATGKPVVLFVHGAWHSPGHYKSLIASLQQAGYIVLAPQLATAGPDDSIIGKSISDDVARLSEAASSHLDGGREIVVVAHSYGGIPATQFCEGRSVSDRAAQGLKGGVRAVVYICSYAPTEKGKSLMDYDPVGDFFDIDGEKGLAVPHRLAIERFYKADIPDTQTQDSLYNHLGNQSTPSFSTGITFGAADIAVPKTYVLCTRDSAILAKWQRVMAEGASARILEIDAGHSPFLVENHVKKLVEVIGVAAGQE
ncbi:Alpha/beta hydrolase fold-1 [Microdochium trichocladiopsis]|uniref:Alpha/beta hydrolase fold-1 n=1 Tax=Microdochium trichocladiopsis TaxID=1682393 RepID=A0A9P8Y069_9PEZI|nr:Alpha/beta hydrolase fold-1 [Microdochium trichocladiopsis]KAH7024441.1 Alpha/beta hydrolase fold-1 [Microdochium trichocladiopsis]